MNMNHLQLKVAFSSSRPRRAGEVCPRYISARFPIASAAKEICRERGRRDSHPDLADTRAKVVASINVGSVRRRRHFDVAHIEVKILGRVNRLRMAHVRRIFSSCILALHPRLCETPTFVCICIRICSIRPDPLCIAYVR